MNCKGKMSFGNYVFPVNPYMIKISHNRTTAVQRTPKGNDVVSDMGVNCRIVSGEGELFGDDCHEKFLYLKSIFENGGTGVLYIPSQKPMYAVFKELELMAEDIEGVIRYRFVFYESFDKRLPTKYIRCIADGKKSLWDIAFENGCDIETLMETNPDISRPDMLVPAGKEVALC